MLIYGKIIPANLAPAKWFSSARMFAHSNLIFLAKHIHNALLCAILAQTLMRMSSDEDA